MALLLATPTLIMTSARIQSIVMVIAYNTGLIGAMARLTQRQAGILTVPLRTLLILGAQEPSITSGFKRDAPTAVGAAGPARLS